MGVRTSHFKNGCPHLFCVLCRDGCPHPTTAHLRSAGVISGGFLDMAAYGMNMLILRILQVLVVIQVVTIILGIVNFYLLHVR